MHTEYLIYVIIPQGGHTNQLVVGYVSVSNHCPDYDEFRGGDFGLIVPEPSAAGAAPMETDLNDDDEEEAIQPEPAPKPEVQRRGQMRSCDGTVVAAPPAGGQVAERAHLASIQASQRTVSNPPSPRHSNMDVDSSQTLHVTHSGRGIPPPKGLGASSSSPFKTTLPMFLEQGNFCGLLYQSEHQQFMDRQLVRIVDHIIKVTPYHISLMLSI